MADSNDTFFWEPLAKAVGAAEERRWGAAVQHLRSIPWPISIEKVSQKGLSVSLSRAAWTGGFLFSREALPVFDLPGGPSDTSLFPQVLSDALFDHDLAAFRRHLQDANWEGLADSFRVLCELPGACASREEAITTAFISLLVTVEALQVDVMAEFSGRNPAWRSGTRLDLSKAADPTAFAMPGILVEYSARLDAYPSLGRTLLLETLAVAKWPVLCTLDLGFVTSMACEVDELYDDSSVFSRLGVKGRVWLEKAAISDGRDELGSDQM
jgi:hypothetical protein